MGSTRWCFTLNNPDQVEVADFHLLCSDESKVVYAVFGDEVGSNGTPHVQGFCVFKSVKRLSGVRKLLSRAHWEKAKGTSSEASEYCKKDGKFVEYGVCPEDTRLNSNRVKDDWEKVRQLAKEGKFDEIPAHIYVRWKNNLHSIYEDSCQARECISDLDHLWIYGSTGIGKSKYCWENFPNAFRKPLNKWWDHYTDQEVIIIEDVDPSHEKWLGSFLKIWSDHYPFIGERKGGSKQIRPKKIVVTSNYLISDIWSEDGMLLPLQRRFKEYTIDNGALAPL